MNSNHNYELSRKNVLLENLLNKIAAKDCCTTYAEFDNSSKNMIQEKFMKDSNQIENIARCNFATLQSDELTSNPVIPENVYENLPSFLKRTCGLFKDERERDVILTSALTLVGGSQINYQGNYDNRNVYPNLYSFIVAPPSSGKGCMSFSKKLGFYIQNEIMEENARTLGEYKKNVKKSKEKGAEINLVTSPPKIKAFFLPANSSAAALIATMNDSNYGTIMFETEADTLNNALRQKWGGFSDVLRSAFHHESVQVSRKSDNREYINIESPKLSLALSGTPNQIMNLLHTPQNGLFSRFMIYNFDSDIIWKDVSGKDSPNLEIDFDKLAIELKSMYDLLKDKSIKFQLTDLQWKTLNQTFDSWQSGAVVYYGEETVANVRRIGLSFYRITMILTMLRAIENKKLESVLTCDDIDFKSALQIAKVYLIHGILMHQKMARITSEPKSKITELLKKLPKNFSKKIAIEVAEEIGVKSRTVHTYLQELLSLNKIKNTEFGKFSKV